MLTLFDASGNLLNGTMPQDFGKSNTKLTHLDVGDNQLSGFIPSSLEGLTTLVHLSLSKNTLSGTLPTFVGELSRLKYLCLNENRLVGTISPAWGINGSQLTEVSLQDNMLSGSIPSSLSLLSNLIDFYVHGKEFRLLTMIASICTLHSSALHQATSSPEPFQARFVHPPLTPTLSKASPSNFSQATAVQYHVQPEQ